MLINRSLFLLQLSVEVTGIWEYLVVVVVTAIKSFKNLGAS